MFLNSYFVLLTSRVRVSSIIAETILFVFYLSLFLQGGSFYAWAIIFLSLLKIDYAEILNI